MLENVAANDSIEQPAGDHVWRISVAPMMEKWSLMAFAKYSSLPDEIKDSPYIEPDTSDTASVFIGFVRGF